MKDFDSWNNIKKSINKKDKMPFYHKREIWWCSLGINVGFEQDGTGKNYDRPVLVIKGFSKDLFWGVALTGCKRFGQYYFPLGVIEKRESSAVLSQVRVIDTRRLIRKITTIDEALFLKVCAALKNALFL